MYPVLLGSARRYYQEPLSRHAERLGVRILAMPYECLRLVQDGMIATITLDRPDAANSINLELAQELLNAAQACDDPGVRAVIVTGSGSTFSTGGDLKEFVTHGEQVASYLREVTVPLHAAVAL